MVYQEEKKGVQLDGSVDVAEAETLFFEALRKAEQSTQRLANAMGSLSVKQKEQAIPAPIPVLEMVQKMERDQKMEREQPDINPKEPEHMPEVQETPVPISDINPKESEPKPEVEETPVPISDINPKEPEPMPEVQETPVPISDINSKESEPKPEEQETPVTISTLDAATEEADTIPKEESIEQEAEVTPVLDVGAENTKIIPTEASPKQELETMPISAQDVETEQPDIKPKDSEPKPEVEEEIPVPISAPEAETEQADIEVETKQPESDSKKGMESGADLFEQVPEVFIRVLDAIGIDKMCGIDENNNTTGLTADEEEKTHRLRTPVLGDSNPFIGYVNRIDFCAGQGVVDDNAELPANLDVEVESAPSDSAQPEESAIKSTDTSSIDLPATQQAVTPTEAVDAEADPTEAVDAEAASASCDPAKVEEPAKKSVDAPTNDLPTTEQAVTPTEAVNMEAVSVSASFDLTKVEEQETKSLDAPSNDLSAFEQTIKMAEAVNISAVLLKMGLALPSKEPEKVEEPATKSADTEEVAKTTEATEDEKIFDEQVIQTESTNSVPFDEM